MATSKEKGGPATYTKDHILTFKRFRERRDLLSVLLEDGKTYTINQVDSLIDEFMKPKGKGKVK